MATLHDLNTVARRLILELREGVVSLPIWQSRLQHDAPCITK